MSNYFVGSMVDAVAPILTYFILHALGVPPVAAMIFGTAVAVISTVINTVRRKKVDGIGVLVIVEIAASILLTILIRDPRLAMIKPSFYSGIGALYLFYTAMLGESPATFEGARGMATRGDALRIVAYERAWERSAEFRATHRIATMGWGLACLVDAILRVGIVYSFPAERAIWLANVPHIAAIVILIAFSALVGRRTKPLVEEQLRLLLT